MASVLNLTFSAVSPLQTLQAKYSLYKGGSDIWVIETAQVEAYLRGGPQAPTILKRSAAELLMRRDLEALPGAT